MGHFPSISCVLVSGHSHSLSSVTCEWLWCQTRREKKKAQKRLWEHPGTQFAIWQHPVTVGEPLARLAKIPLSETVLSKLGFWICPQLDPPTAGSAQALAGAVQALPCFYPLLHSTVTKPHSFGYNSQHLPRITPCLTALLLADCYQLRLGLYLLLCGLLLSSKPLASSIVHWGLQQSPPAKRSLESPCPSQPQGPLCSGQERDTGFTQSDPECLVLACVPVVCSCPMKFP